MPDEKTDASGQEHVSGDKQDAGVEIKAEPGSKVDVQVERTADDRDRKVEDKSNGD